MICSGRENYTTWPGPQSSPALTLFRFAERYAPAIRSVPWLDYLKGVPGGQAARYCICERYADRLVAQGVELIRVDRVPATTQREDDRQSDSGFGRSHGD